MTFAERTVEILEPYVGRTVADTAVRGSALAAGKLSDDLGSDDLPALVSHVRRLLGPVVPGSSLDRIVDEIKGAAA